MAAEKIIILGTGGNCVDILETLEAINRAERASRYECAGFLDDKESLWGTKINGIKIDGPLGKATSYTDCQFVNGIGSPNNFWKKKEILSRTGLDLESFITIVHPTASVSPSALLGQGTVIFQNVTICSNVTIGHQVIILPGSIISHDDKIGDYTCIAGGVCVSGSVTIGDSCYLGSNSSIIGNVSIGRGSLVGMGAVVLEDVPPEKVVVGNPARVIRAVGSDL